MVFSNCMSINWDSLAIMLDESRYICGGRPYFSKRMIFVNQIVGYIIIVYVHILSEVSFPMYVRTRRMR